MRQVFEAVEDLVAELDRLHAQPHGKHAVRCVLEAMERVVMGEEGWFPPCLRMQVALALRARNPQLYGGGRGTVCVHVLIGVRCGPHAGRPTPSGTRPIC